MQILNLTPHDVVVEVGATKIIYPASGIVARVLSTPQVEIERIEDGQVPVYSPQVPCGVELPGVGNVEAILVSMMVAEALGHEVSTDFELKSNLRGQDVRVFAPDTGPRSAVRNDKGQIVAVRNLVEYEPFSFPRKRTTAE